jgi:hypothetical protein
VRCGAGTDAACGVSPGCVGAPARMCAFVAGRAGALKIRSFMFLSRVPD